MIAKAQTIYWTVDNQTYQTMTCESGGTVTPPSPPQKTGYTFVEWRGYTPIEYLESSGTQYIDTGFAFNADLRAKPFAMDFTISVLFILTGNSVQPPFVGSTGYVMRGSQYAWSPQPNSIAIYAYGANIQALSFLAPQMYTPYHFRYEFYQSQGIIIGSNDETTTTRDIGGDTGELNISNSNIYLFKQNGYSSGAKIRIHAFSFESDGVKIRDFIPVLDTAGVPCMFDKVENKFYYNAGTGQFIAGPVLTE